MCVCYALPDSFSTPDFKPGYLNSEVNHVPGKWVPLIPDLLPTGKWRHEKAKAALGIWWERAIQHGPLSTSKLVLTSMWVHLFGGCRQDDGILHGSNGKTAIVWGQIKEKTHVVF